MRIRWAAALVALAMPVTVMAQRPGPAAAVQADAATVIAAVRAAIAANYVVPGKRAALDAVLAKGLAEGRYANLAPHELAQRVTHDLETTAQDKHLGMRHDPAFATQIGARGLRDDGPPPAFFQDMARRRNHGVTELKVLDGNVRYLAYDGFMWSGDESGRAIDAAMAFLKGGDAAIIDLRRNGGGSPDAVRHLTSWFVPGGTRLVTFHMRQEAPTTSVTAATVPGSLGGIPIYVLTSGRSASAAEEFASHVVGFGFATLVGETTAGAAYRNEFFAIPGGYVLSVSVGRPELPGGGDWEGKGVAPKVAVPQDRALAAAQSAALGLLAAKAEGPVKTELEWAAALQAATASPVAPARPLASYSGTYGERVIDIDGDRLLYRRGGGPKTALVPISADLFALEADPRTRVRFLANGTMAIERIDGSKQEVPKS